MRRKHWLRIWGIGEALNNGTHEIGVCSWALGLDARFFARAKVDMPSAARCRTPRASSSTKPLSFGGLLEAVEAACAPRAKSANKSQTFFGGPTLRSGPRLRCYAAAGGASESDAALKQASHCQVRRACA